MKLSSDFIISFILSAGNNRGSTQYRWEWEWKWQRKWKSPAPTVITSIKLLVLDENGMMVANAKLQSGTTIVYSNEFGIAEFKNIRVTANKAMVKVNVPGYSRS